MVKWVHEFEYVVFNKNECSVEKEKIVKDILSKRGNEG